MSKGIELISRERNKQLSKWGDEHDSTHLEGELSWAAASCLERAIIIAEEDKDAEQMFDWPWDTGDDRKVDDRIVNLVKAGALIAAEIDRLSKV